MPQSSDSLQLTRADQCVDQFEDELEKAQTEEEARQQIQERLPGGEEWKARIGAAGTPLEQQRVSPIVELSMLLVQLPPPFHSPLTSPLLFPLSPFLCPLSFLSLPASFPPLWSSACC